MFIKKFESFSEESSIERTYSYSKICLDDYLTEYDNIFKHRYRNLKNGEIKELEEIFNKKLIFEEGDSLKIFNPNDFRVEQITLKQTPKIKRNIYKDKKGGEYIKFIHKKKAGYAYAWPKRKKANDEEETYYLMPVPDVLKIYDIEEFLIDLNSKNDNSRCIISAFDHYDEQHTFDVKNFRFVYEERRKNIFLIDIDIQRVYDIEMSLPIEFYSSKSVNLEDDPWCEENWD